MADHKLCLFCGRWYDRETMTPLFEKGTDYIAWYCEECLPTVRENVANLPYSRLFT
jgi:hypothetical protein